jgi:superfamily II DNA or RNA helicase
MPFVHDLSRFFSGTVRERGREYFHRRAVAIHRGDAWRVQADVAGGRTYRVELRRDRTHQTITAWCDCPFVERDERPCKHIWATLLAADARHLLLGEGSRPVGGLAMDQVKLDRRAGIIAPDDRDEAGVDARAGVAGITGGAGASRALDEDDDHDPDGDEDEDEDQEDDDEARSADRDPFDAFDKDQGDWEDEDDDLDEELDQADEDELSEAAQGDGDRGPGGGTQAYWSGRQQGRPGTSPAGGPGSDPDSEADPLSSSPGVSTTTTSSTHPAHVPRVAQFPRRDRNLERATPSTTAKRPEWQRRLASFLPPNQSPQVVRAPRAQPREIVYLVDISRSAYHGSLTLEIGWRDRKTGGEWGRYRTKAYVGAELMGATTEADERVIGVLTGHNAMAAMNPSYAHVPPVLTNHVSLAAPLVDLILPDLCAGGRCRLRRRTGDDDLTPLEWDAGDPWELWLELRVDEERDVCVLDGSLRRGDERMHWNDALLLLHGHLVTGTHVARFDDRGGIRWIALFATEGSFTVPRGDVESLLAEISTRPGSPHLDVDERLGVQIVRGAPKRRLAVRSSIDARSSGLQGDVTFEYGGIEVPWDASADRLFMTAERRVVQRNRDAEQTALRELTDVGFRPIDLYDEHRTAWELRPSRLPAAVRMLTTQGWRVEAEGRPYRAATATRARVSSGIDWFDLEGTVEFGDVSVSIAAVMEALARGRTVVTLGDGSHGVLPEDWLARQGHWAALGERHGDQVRFTLGQVGVLDALLAAASVSSVEVDAQFTQAREALREFAGVTPADPPTAFQGELRAYQRDGLGWIRFLEQFGFGGCLADDMGLGKTIQVLAALADRRASGVVTRPSLVIVPRSLVFNWQREAARFVPTLRLLDHTGTARLRDGEGFAAAFDEVDLVITTYGTLRRDAAHLAEIEFDYVILDEAHAIKNTDSQTTKAVRVLRGRHRLALTGTPVQNHLGELWSLFEFLNPGMLGRSSAFARVMSVSGSEGATRQEIGRMLRPFVLRRTKADVARDLPPRVEDTIVCRLDGGERQFYDELRAHYRQSLGSRIERDGWAKSKMHVLEALLRLRQAACHPGLVDRTKQHESSAKLDVLLSQLREVHEEGHKAIVFSQFVRLLDIVRASLDKEGITYAYLDGGTRDREAQVTRFQTDPDCKLFLVSLKAGGLGLNLTAAEYVFLLDPWWNPAIEAQAIDRAHRIGQTQQVFAYRLIAEDTIEEKVIALQARKRELADAILGDSVTDETPATDIVSGDSSGGLTKLTREDLELLLS